MEASETQLFGELLKIFRKQAGFSQEALAYKIGLKSRGSIQAWESGLYLPQKRETVLELARVLSLSKSKTDRLLLAAHHLQEHNTQGILASATEKEEQTMQYTLRNEIQRNATSDRDTPGALQEQICDNTRLIQEKTHDFVGRKFVFDAVTRFVDTHPRGYYFIQGDPGIGKSALAAQMVKTNGYVHHFNILSQGINTADIFLRNVCAQLIVVYQLDYAFLPLKATQNAEFLNALLEKVSGKLGPQEKAIIVIDALDEVDISGLASGVNALYLPDTLPRGIYMIVTTRKKSINLRIDCEYDTLTIEHDSAENITDIRKYIEQAVRRPELQTYITTQGINNESFIKYLIEKSEYNFMYLSYVLPQIGHGYYNNRPLTDLPLGLQSYYGDHWRRMRAKDEDVWFKYKLPSIMALVEAKEPISIDLIAGFSQIQERARIREVIHEWTQFLHEKEVPCEGILQKRYSVYHTSFQDFITRQEQAGEKGVSRAEADEKIINNMLSGLELFDDL